MCDPKNAQPLSIKKLHTSRFISQMASSICRRLIRRKWSSYADDLENVPEVEGIYTMGIRRANDGQFRYLYVGHSKNIHRRLMEHKHKKQKIDLFIKKRFKENGGRGLGIKWVDQKHSKRKEGVYIDCMEDKIGYRLKYNIKRGNHPK